MDHRYENILNPVGAVGDRGIAPRISKLPRRGRTVVGLLDNSKPNVAIFMEGIAEALRARGDCDIVTAVKPRSAAASPDLEALAAQCDFVVNAVAD